MFHKNVLGKFIPRVLIILGLFLFATIIHVNVPEKGELVQQFHLKLSNSFNKEPYVSFLPPLDIREQQNKTIKVTTIKSSKQTVEQHDTKSADKTSAKTAEKQAAIIKTAEEKAVINRTSVDRLAAQARYAAAVKGARALEVSVAHVYHVMFGGVYNLPYISKLDKLIRGDMIPTDDVVTPVPGAINLGMVIVNIPKEKVKQDDDSLRYGFVYKTLRTLTQILDQVGPTPLHFIIVTNSESASWAGRLIAAAICKRLTMDIIQPRTFRWRKSRSLPEVYFSLVDSDLMIKLNPSFNKGMKENLMPTDKTDKYRSDFYYIAPNYHKAFTSLNKAVFIDATDLEFTIDVKELWDQFEDLGRDQSAIMSLGLDLAPHYFLFLKDYLEKHPDSTFGQPGRNQGFNTGVVLYRFDRMRRSEVYNSFLNREKVNFLVQKFGYQISLAEQDFFTNLNFIHPELFHILPCQFNKQVSIQYNRPPFEAVFDSYHYCDKKENIKIFHLNGCGPSPKDCGQTPGPDSKYFNKTGSQFLHMDMAVYWQTMVSIRTGNWDWQDRLYEADTKKYKFLSKL